MLLSSFLHRTPPFLLKHNLQTLFPIPRYRSWGEKIIQNLASLLYLWLVCNILVTFFQCTVPCKCTITWYQWSLTPSRQLYANMRPYWTGLFFFTWGCILAYLFSAGSLPHFQHTAQGLTGSPGMPDSRWPDHCDSLRLATTTVIRHCKDGPLFFSLCEWRGRYIESLAFLAEKKKTKNCFNK